MYYTENLSFNMSKKMRKDLENIGKREEKKISTIIREMILQEIKRKKTNESNT